MFLFYGLFFSFVLFCFVVLGFIVNQNKPVEYQDRVSVCVNEGKFLLAARGKVVR